MKTFIIALVVVVIIGTIIRMAFRKKKPTPQAPPSSVAPPPAPAKDAFCPNCGAKVARLRFLRQLRSQVEIISSEK